MNSQAWTFSAPPTLANHFHTQEKEKEPMMNDTCGPTLPEPFAFYDPDSSCLRTSQATFLLDSMKSSVTLPKWGSMRSGALYERPTLVRPTSELDCSLLPTPAVNDMGTAYTPEEWDEWTDKMRAKHGNENGHGKSLSVEAQRLCSPRPEVRTERPET